ncbi:probable long-chain-alcohol O-fatty-acyltransferase 5 [Elaeis guineensis]|uniref:Probable long-chain-alcohol O-fatty-acyltransferase 5 n=1 Tax=Elaeis guineensis var. tenera TaxID=51953 RepID=A0A6I9QCD0_ELAGV|nr:probable long-chain-alcohol O-fatty-acyltransferase 5 [Elaeis guineensis]
MEKELRSLAKVYLLVAVSMTYSRYAASTIRPGNLRLVALFPVLCLLPCLPWSFSSINLRGISAFFLAWLALFKLVLLAFGLGPLSPSLPLLPFLFTSSFPVKLQTKPNPKPPISSSLSTLHLLVTAVKVLLLAAIISIHRYRDGIHPYFLLAMYCFYIYLGLDLCLTSMGKIATGLLGLELEPHFNNPCGASSLQDFWGRRWNLMVSAILRPSVYDPVRARWGRDAGILATFLVSGLMHELMFYYLTLALPTGEVTAFFVLQGLFTVAEKEARKAGWWRLHPVAAAPLAIGFIVGTGYWLFFPPLLRGGVDKIGLAECYAVMGFLGDAGGALLGLLGFL